MRTAPNVTTTTTMTFTTTQQRISRRALLARGVKRVFTALLLLCVIGLAGCAGGPTQTGPGVNGTPATTCPPTSASTPAVRPHVNVQFLRDITGSYPTELGQAAVAQTAHAIEAWVGPGNGGLTFSLTYIDARPFAQESNPFSMVIPATASAPPAPVLQPTPTPSANDPYTNAQAKMKAQQANDHALACYHDQLNQEQAALGTLRAQVHTQLQRLVALQPTQDNRGTSIWAAIELAAQRLSSASGEKWLLVATDGQDNIDDTSAARLDGVHIVFLDFYSPDARTWQAVSSYWRSHLLSIGAASVDFYDGQASATLPPLFGAGQ